jgi:glycerol-3-phosphate dehydrogenase
VGNNEAVTVISPLDGRVMFVVPWGEQTYVGTTDTDYSGSPDAVGPDAADVLYLLRSANALFPNARLQADDVTSAWAGLRPLFRPSDDRDPGAVSREHRIAEGATGLISVLGGKLTTHRAMAAETVDMVLRALRRLDGRASSVPSRTDREPLLGGEVRDLDLLIQEAIREGAPEAEARRLVHLYGTETVALVRAFRADAQLARPIAAGHPATRAQLFHALRREMAATLSDLLVRRLRVFHEAPGHAAAEAPVVVDLVAGELGWDASRQAAELATYLEEVGQMLSFRAHLRKRLSGPAAEP